MAIQDDMDICLNITGKNNNSPKQILSEARVKRLNKNPNERAKKSFRKFQSTESSKSLLVGAKKRIKQKSLAAIVANNLQKVNQPNVEPKVSILKNSSTVVPSKGIGKQSDSKVGKKKGLLQAVKRVSFGQKNDSDVPLVSFTKEPTKNIIKNVLARKRKDVTDKPKKSLSNIFKTSDTREVKLLQNYLGTDEESSVSKNTGPEVLPLNQVFEEHKTRIRNDEGTRNSQFPTGRKQKFLKPEAKTTGVALSDDSSHEKQVKRINSNKQKKREKTESKDDGRNYSHSSGKISSLFGNNPEVPNIGQRLVKPVSEEVFTAEKFSELDIHEYSVSNLEQNMEITTMTTVQKKAIPVILSGRDVLIRSQTGSGKTLSYALPIVEKLQKIRPKLTRNSGVRGLVIVPTRELALQTYECFLKLVKPFTWIVPGYLVGGEKRKAEKARLRKGCNILVATPGRLLDHIRHTEALKLNIVELLVLDEADRMFDMGYEKDISGILDELNNTKSQTDDGGYDALEILRQHVNPESKKRSKSEDETTKMTDEIDGDSDEKCDESEDDDEEGSHSCDDSQTLQKKQQKDLESSSSTGSEHPKRQTVLLSATLTHAVEKLAGLSMNDPVFVDAARENIEASGGSSTEINEDLIVPHSVTQNYVVTPPKLRMVTLSGYIAGKCQSHGSHKILVFMATQDMVDYHTNILSSVLGKPIDEEDEDSDPLVDIEFFKLHGSMSQKERTEIFKTFRQTKSGVLLCTDVAARGLDLPKVDTVVQYTGPTSLRDYVHRIGRTARAGSSGVATIFLTPPEIEFVRMLEKRRIRIKQEDMDDVLSKLLVPLSKHNSVQAAAIALQNDFENLVLENKKYHDMACKAYTSWVRFYSSYPREMREAFDRKSLHLGHYAKSFALRDPPQRIGVAGKSIREKEEAQRPKPKHQNRLSYQRNNQTTPAKKSHSQPQQQSHRPSMLKKVRMLNVSEYDSGLDPVKKTRKS